MTFRGSFERDVKAFAEQDAELQTAIAAEDDDAVETIMNERFYHQPKMYYSPDKLIRSYGVPRRRRRSSIMRWGKSHCPQKTTWSPTRSTRSPRASILRYREQKWLDAIAQLVADDPELPAAFQKGRHDPLQLDTIQSARRHQGTVSVPIA